MIHKINKTFKRVGFAVGAGLLALGVAVPALFHAGNAYANGQVTLRKITIGSSAASASTTYHVVFTPATTTTVGGIVVDICDNDPLIGDTSCTYPAGFSWGTPGTLTGSLTVNGGMGTGWTATGVQGGAGASASQVLHLDNATPQSLSTGTPVDFTFSSTTNPSTANHSFYARIVTFDTTAHVSNYTISGTTRASSFVGQVDYGGIALSTASNISITAKVYETLAFCIFDNTASCGTAPTLNLGSSSTGALDTSNTYINTKASYTLATNAANGVSVTMTGTTLCRVTPLNSTNCPTGASANTIGAIGNTAQLVNGGSFGPNNEAFGMCVDVTGSSALAAVAPYNDTGTGNNCHTGITVGQQTTYSGTSKFGFDDNTSTGTNSAGGDQVLSASGAVSTVTNAFAFVGNVAATTEAGVYQSNLNLVATGTF